MRRKDLRIIFNKIDIVCGLDHLRSGVKQLEISRENLSGKWERSLLIFGYRRAANGTWKVIPPELNKIFAFVLCVATLAENIVLIGERKLRVSLTTGLLSGQSANGCSLKFEEFRQEAQTVSFQTRALTLKSALFYHFWFREWNRRKLRPMTIDCLGFVGAINDRRRAQTNKWRHINEV